MVRYVGSTRDGRPRLGLGSLSRIANGHWKARWNAKMEGRRQLVSDGMELCRWRCSQDDWQSYVGPYLDRAVGLAKENETVNPAFTMLVAEAEAVFEAQPPETVITATGILYGQWAGLWSGRGQRLSRVELDEDRPVRLLLHFQQRIFIPWITGEVMEVLGPMTLPDQFDEVLQFLDTKARG